MKTRWLWIALLLAGVVQVGVSAELDPVRVALRGDIAAVQTYLEDSGDINATFPAKTLSRLRERPVSTTLLGEAIMYNQLELIRFLLENGADVNQPANEVTPLTATLLTMWEVSEAPPEGVEILPAPDEVEGAPPTERREKQLAFMREIRDLLLGHGAVIGGNASAENSDDDPILPESFLKETLSLMLVY